MKTEVIMKRELFGVEISQKSQSEFFSATDMVKAGNNWRAQNNLALFDLNDYFATKSTKSFMEELKNKYGQVLIRAKNKYTNTWVHPLLFIDIALSISPSLKIEVYEWLFDNLIRFRNDSGDSYKKMSGALFAHTKSQRLFYKEIADIAEKIKVKCNVKDWQHATEQQLRQRDKLHEAIALLSDVLKDNNQAVRLGILKA